MSDGSAIEWTDATWNPIRARHKGRPVAVGKLTREIGWHCEHVSEACRNCYAERINRRLGTGLDFKPGHRKDIEIFLDEKTLAQPLKWRKPRMIFPCSMTDLFGDWVSDEMLDRIFAVMALTPQHTYQVLTKRPERMRAYLSNPLRRNEIELAMEKIQASKGKPWSPKHCIRWPLPNVWLVVSVGDQPDADKFVPVLLDTPAAVRGVSYEPALGPVSFRWATWQPWKERGTTDHLDGLRRLDWVICGGESGPAARPMNPQWARDLRDECAEAGVPFFFKQWGEWEAKTNRDGWNLCRDHAVFADDGVPKFYRGWPPGGGTNAPCEFVERVGKKSAGRLLDGIEHNGFPEHA